MEMERDELGYAGGRGISFIVFIVVTMAVILIGYTVMYFFPDLANWMGEGVNPDRIIWQTEIGK